VVVRVPHRSSPRLPVRPPLGTARGRGSCPRCTNAKLFPGGARAWDWRETGTSHDPGIQPADVEELLERGATAVVLSKGFDERLGVTGDALRVLEERGVCAHLRQTEEAIRLYNELGETERVGALIHSTC
jgi:hypothetical protein